MSVINTGDTVEVVYREPDGQTKITVDVTWSADMKFSGIVTSETYDSKEVDVFIEQESIRLQNQGEIGNIVEILKVV